MSDERRGRAVYLKTRIQQSGTDLPVKLEEDFEGAGDKRYGESDVSSSIKFSDEEDD